MCLYPKRIKNRALAPNKKNGGNPPILSKEDKTDLEYIWAPCLNCEECLKGKANDYKVRLTEHIKTHKNGKFVLLTISDENWIKLAEDVKKNNPEINGYDLENAIFRLAVNRFKDRYKNNYGKTLQIFTVSELGPNNTERIHGHATIWTDLPKKEIDALWGYGYLKGGRTWEEEKNFVNGATINYMIKYVFKTDLKHPNYKPVVIKPYGLGKDFLKSSKAKDNEFKGEKTRTYYQNYNGTKTGLPSYYKNNYYTDDQRRELTLLEIRKNIKSVRGVKIDVSTPEGIESYQLALKQARKKSKELGYPGGEINHEQFEYERNQRIHLEKERIKRVNEKKIKRPTRQRIKRKPKEE